MELVILAIVVSVVAVYFLFIRTKTDPRVKELADLAYTVAAELAGLPKRGSTPPVRLKDGLWKHGGGTVVGLYTWTGLFGKVLWDRVLVLDNPVYIWPILVHEMTHAVRRRAGKKTSELAAEVAMGLADKKAPPEVAALLKKL